MSLITHVIISKSILEKKIILIINQKNIINKIVHIKDFTSVTAKIMGYNGNKLDSELQALKQYEICMRLYFYYQWNIH